MTRDQYIDDLIADFARYGFIASPLTIGEMRECYYKGLTVSEAYNIGCDVYAGFDFKGLIGDYDAE